MITVETESPKKSKLAYRSIAARFKLGIQVARAARRAGLDPNQYERFEMGLASTISNREFHRQLLQLEWEAEKGHPLP